LNKQLYQRMVKVQKPRYVKPKRLCITRFIHLVV